MSQYHPSSPSDDYSEGSQEVLIEVYGRAYDCPFYPDAAEDNWGGVGEHLMNTNTLLPRDVSDSPVIVAIECERLGNKQKSMAVIESC